jgi:exosortase
MQPSARFARLIADGFILELTIFPLFFIAAFFPLWKQLVLTWAKSEDYSHGFLVVPLALYILWHKRTNLKKATLQPSSWGLPLASISLSLYALGQLAGIFSLAAFSMVLFISSAIVYLFGFPMLRVLLFPSFILLFMIPIPAQISSSLTIQLQIHVSKASTALASSLGIPVYLDGNVLHIPGRTLLVVEACSGLRSMLSILLLSTIFAHFTLHSKWLKAGLIAAALPVGYILNIMRIFIILFSLNYFRLDLTDSRLHTCFGLFIFALATISIDLTRRLLSLCDTSS